MKDDDAPLLLTPGPLTTARTTREAMLRDWGSRDQAFLDLNARVRQRVVEVAGGIGTHVCVPVQGSGTFAVEAAIGTLVPRAGKLLVLVNGAYGRRMVQICKTASIDCVAHEWQELEPVDAAATAKLLDADPEITHVAVVHCETTTGLLNPIEAVANVVAERQRGLLVDAMSAFGAIELSAKRVRYDALMASSNKCIEGTPGVGFAIVRTEALAKCEGNARSLSLDLFDQWRGFEKTNQWRFTPPTHVLAAFDRALSDHAAEGGVVGRGSRYRENCKTLVDGMRAMGFQTALPDELQAPIIVTFLLPCDARFGFKRFYDLLAQRGFLIYPGKLTQGDTFRIGCIGQVFPDDMRRAVAAVREAIDEMGVKECAP
ncbi:MAG TPA: 2-aminoethylphosphonate--pyruvate transaminase [Candidatus Acidoferrales bacterium]|nr:2-aminoethylphosphonate--pyruvate transaminase [Candidatus Acidoferrales bacterium]